MPKTDPAKLWSLNYRLLMSVISSVAPDIAALGLETKELFVPKGRCFARRLRWQHGRRGEVQFEAHTQGASGYRAGPGQCGSG